MLSLGLLATTLSLAFEPNVGQHGDLDASVRFVCRADGFGLELRPDGVGISLRGPDESWRRLGIRFAGAAAREPIASEPLPGESHYFVGRDASRWRPKVSRFGRVAYHDIYPGVDAVFYVADGKVEYDIVIGPDAAANALSGIELLVEGADELCIDGSGELRIDIDGAEMVQHRPKVVAPGSLARDGSYVLLGRQSVGFAVAGHRRGETLVIDPVLQYSTYLGGGRNDAAYAIAVDPLGYAYVAGFTSSLNFPTSSPLQPNCGSCGPSSTDAFVAKIAPDGSTLVFSTFLGGSGMDLAFGVALDQGGNVYVAGGTDSDDFPIAGAFQTQRRGGFDAFVTHILEDGSAIVYSTYLGGGADDHAAGIVVTAGYSANVVGTTHSSDFPVAAAIQPALAGSPDAFVAKLLDTGAGLIYSTYLGDSSWDEARSIALDSQRNAYVAGDLGADHLVRLAPQGSAIIYRTRLPIPGVEARAVAVDGAYAYLGAERPSCQHGSTDAILARIDGSGVPQLITDITWCGLGTTSVTAVAADMRGNAFVTGGTSSRALETCPTGTYFGKGARDAFVAMVSAQGEVMPFSTTLGGGDFEQAYGVAVDTGGTVWLAGETRSSDFPTTLPLQGALANDEGTRDAFITRLAESPPVGPPEAGFYAGNRSGPPPLTVTFRDLSVCEITSRLWSFGDGSTSTAKDPVHTYTAEGVYTVSLTATNAAGSDAEVRPDYVSVGDPITTDFAASPAEGVTPLAVQFDNLTTGNATSWLWSFGDGSTSTAFEPTHAYTTLGAFDVSLLAIGPYARNAEYKPGFIVTHEVLPDFGASPRIIRPGQVLQLTSLASGNVVSLTWDFGDGATSTSVNPVHIYTMAGYYDVSLTARGPTTTETLARDDYLLVSPLRSTNIAVAPGPDPQALPRIRAHDVLGVPYPATDFLVYGTPGFGANVGTGDIDGAPVDEVLTGPGPSPVFGPQVRAFTPSGAPLPKVSFYAYGTLRYGVLAAGAALAGGSAGEILTGPGPSASFGPHARGFRIESGRPAALSSVSFYAFSTLRHGVELSSATIEGDGSDEILAAPGPGPTFGPNVRAFRYAGQVATIPGVNFFAFPSTTHGARVDGSLLDGVPTEQILAGPGPGPGNEPTIRGFRLVGTAIQSIPEVDVLTFPGGLFGVEPGGGDLDGDGIGEILAARGADPAAGTDVRGYDYIVAGGIPKARVTAIPSLSFAPYGSGFGVHASTGDLGF